LGGSKWGAEGEEDTLLYIHTDHLGSAVRMTDGAGEVVQSTAYDSYGRTVYSSGAQAPRYQLTGQEMDAGTGLYYYGARYSDPSNKPEITDGPDVFDEQVSSSESDDEQQIADSEEPTYVWDEEGDGKSFNEIFSDSVYKHSRENETDDKGSYCNAIVCGVVGDCGFDTTPFINAGIPKMIENLDGLANKPGGGVNRCTSFQEAQNKADANIGNYPVIILYQKTKHHVAFVRNRHYSGNRKYGNEIGMRAWKNANCAIAGGGLTKDQIFIIVHIFNRTYVFF